MSTVLLWTALATSHAFHNKGKSLKRRILGEHTLRYAALHASVAQNQFVLGTTLTPHKTKQMKLGPVVDELGENAHLVWIRPKRVECVLVFCHGTVAPCNCA
ncbi:hypothetical protein B0H13DRAFT_1890264 [Mycena leptocephala]|nr:hypothetical protein B0H13DRAFT_1890264 [Mycena leptocephala]